MKKRIIPALMIAALGAIALSGMKFSPSMVKAEEDLTPNFDEDFESYSLEGNAYVDEMGEKWTSAYYKHLGDGDALASDPKHYKVVADPKDETNKVLHIDTASDNESFFYITMKDIYTKDFRLSYDFMHVSSTKVPWAGFNFRKPVDGRYNGVTNVMAVLRCWSDDNYGTQFYRSVDTSFVDLTSSVVGPNQEPGGVGWNEVIGGDDFEGCVNTWLHVTIEALDTKFSISITGHLLAEVTVTKKTANNYGFVSIVNCVADCYYDNIHLENLDEEPYSDGGGGGETEGNAPTMNVKEYTVDKGSDLVVEVDTHGEAITSLRMGANEILPQYYEIDGTTLTIQAEGLASFGTGRMNFILTTPGGTVGFIVTIVDPSVTPETSTPTSTSSAEPAPSGGGCGGSIAAASIVSIIALSGVALLAFRKRKEK